MVFLVGIAAALSLGLGYVLQQRVASTMPLAEMLHFRLLLDLMRRPLWWAGIAAMVFGQLLSGLALQLATVALVEPLMSTNLIFALMFASLLSRNRIQWKEIAGAVLLCASLAVFILVGSPHSAPRPNSSTAMITLGVCVVLATVGLLVMIAKRRQLVVESVLLAVGAGLLYGLQDASTRAALVVADDHGIGRLLVNPWAYIVLASAVFGILLSQSAFKAARLDYSLPPIAAAEPIAGVALGVSLLGDVVSVTNLGLAVESVCLVGVIAGVALIARSANLAAGGKVSPVPAVPADPV